MEHFRSDDIEGFECAKCNLEGAVSSFATYKELEEHFVLCTSAVVKRCPFCSRYIPNENLSEHIYRIHPEPGQDASQESEENPQSLIFTSKHRKPAMQGVYPTEEDIYRIHPEPGQEAFKESEENPQSLIFTSKLRKPAMQGVHPTESLSVITRRPTGQSSTVPITKNRSPLSNVDVDLTKDDSQEDSVEDNIRTVVRKKSSPLSNVFAQHKDPYESLFPGGFNTQEAQDFEARHSFGSNQHYTHSEEDINKVNGKMGFKKEPPASTVTSDDMELEEIRNRISSRGGKIASKDQDQEVSNGVKKEGLVFVDTMFRGQFLKNQVTCNGERISMATAVLKSIIESKKDDLTKKLQGEKVKSWNKERVREQMKDSGLASIYGVVDRTFYSNVDKVLSDAQACYEAMQPLARTGGGELGDIQNDAYLAPSRNEGKKDLTPEQKLSAELYEEIRHLDRQFNISKKVIDKKDPAEKVKTKFMQQLLKPTFAEKEPEFAEPEEVLEDEEDRNKRAQKRSIDARRLSTEKLRRRDADATDISTSESDADPNEQFKRTIKKVDMFVDKVVQGGSNNSDLANRLAKTEQDLEIMKEENRELKVEVANVKKEVEDARKDLADMKKKFIEGNGNTQAKLDIILGRMNV